MADQDALAESVASREEPNYTKPFVTITVLFFMWGFITVMNDVLIPFLKDSFELTYFQAGLVQFAFFGAFFVISLIYFMVSVIIRDPIGRLGYKNWIMISLFICGLGCCLFYPAAKYGQYAFFLGALFVLASGVTVLQIAANPYAAILGKPENAPSRLNLAQGINSIGTTLAPIAGGLLLFKVFAGPDGVTIRSIQLPYVIYGGMFFLLAVFVKFSHLPAFSSKAVVGKGGGALRYRHLRLGMIAIFLYVGAEVAIGSYLVSYAQTMGHSETVASLYLAYYWGGAMIGRLLGSISLSDTFSGAKQHVSMALVAVVITGLVYVVTAVRIDEGVFSMAFMTPAQIFPYVLIVALNFVAFLLGRSQAGRLLGIFSLIAMGMLILAALGSGGLAFWAAIGVGLFNSIMWSNIFTLAIRDLGSDTAQGSSLLVMMIVGGAIMPPLMGHVADLVGIQLAFLVPVVNYVYLAFYGFAGHKIVLAVTSPVTPVVEP
ncbi:MAG: sugar MFS transporter [bacterium]|nr:sugar MFS transporter [bacterium]